MHTKNKFLMCLQPQELTLLEQKSTKVTYGKRETIVKKGEFSTHFLLIHEGFVKVEMNEDGKNFILDIIPAGSIIGFPTLFNAEKHIFSTTSLTETVIQFIPIEIIRGIIELNGKAALAAIKYSNETFVTPLLDKLQLMSHNNIKGRLAKLLLHFAVNTHRSNRFTLLINRTEIASMIGFSRENVIRVLSEFHAEGTISIKGKQLDILNVRKLEELTRNR